MDNINESRRSMIKKASFIVPAIMTFKLTEMKALASSGVTGNPGYTGKKGKKTKPGYNGNKYGNPRPDRNSRDRKNRHNTAH